MNKHDFMKLQTCVLRVNIQCACEGCNQKIKKILNKIDGVYKTSVDLEHGKVTVYGNAAPATLIKKLKKSGKHAELWGPQKGVNLLNNQLKNIGFDNKNHNSGGGGGGSGGGKGNKHMQATINKGFKDIKPSNKDQKSVNFNLPVSGGGRSGGGFYGEDDFDDDVFDDEFDDEEDDGYDGYDDRKPNKMMTGPVVGGYGLGGPIGMMNGKKGPSAEFELPVQFKGKGGNNDAKKGNGGKKGGGDGDAKGGKKSKEGGGGGGGFGGLFGGKIGGLFLGGGKNKHGVLSPKGGKKGGGGSGREKGGGWDKKGGGKHHGEGKFGSSKKQNEFLEFNKPQNGGGERNMGKVGGNPMMAQMRNHLMGQMGGYPVGQMPSGQGFPIAYRGQGMDHGNPYNQQQYQQQQYMQSMMMNQHKANTYPQMMYGQLPPAAYGPPMGAPLNDNMSHMFSDENTESCSIM